MTDTWEAPGNQPCAHSKKHVRMWKATLFVSFRCYLKVLRWRFNGLKFFSTEMRKTILHITGSLGEER